MPLRRIFFWMPAAAVAAAIVGLATAMPGARPASDAPPGDIARYGPPAVAIWLRMTPVHVDFVLPATTPVHDWRVEFPPESFTAVPSRATHLAFGWGSRDFFVHVREWDDLTLGRAFRAALFDRSVLHAEYVVEPAASPTARRLVVSADQYRRIVEHVRASVVLEDSGRARLLPGLGYTPADNFYEGRGRYTLVTTCNQWVNIGLRAGGIDTALWTPFARNLWDALDHTADTPGVPSGSQADGTAR